MNLLNPLKKALSLFLAASLLIGALASCSETPEQVAEDSAPSAEEPAAEPVPEEEESDSRASAKDSLPDDLDFAGLSVPILYRGGTDEQEIYVEELTGEIVDDAIYNRNVSVSDRLNIVFDYIASGNGTAQDFPAAAKNAITGGVDDYSIISWAQYSVLPLVNQNMILDVNHAKYLDYSKPWWNADYMSVLQIGADHRYFLMGDVNLNALKTTAACFFNQKVYNDFFGDYSELYELVLSGGWTIDVLKEQSEAGWVDENGDGKLNKGDIYGINATTVANTELLAFGLGLTLIGRDEGGMPTLTVTDERNYTVMDKLCDLYWNNSGMVNTYSDTDTFNSPTVSNLFAEDKLLFMPLWLKTCEYLRDMESGYGIIPYPKLDEEQENYISLVQDTSSIFVIPVTCTHPDEISAVLEAMCAENYRTVIPTYYEIALKSKYTRDAVSAAMVDLIHATSMTDFGYAYNYGLGNLGTIMRTVIANNGSMSSTAAKGQKAYKKSLEKLVSSYLEGNG